MCVDYFVLRMTYGIVDLRIVLMLIADGRFFLSACPAYFGKLIN